MQDARYLEDFAVGESFETEAHRVTAEEVIGFARANDPQSFHTDPAAAAAHPVFLGLSASGYQTLTIVHRLILDQQLGHAWGLIGKGLDRVRWKRPVRPGDTLMVRARVAAIDADPARPFGTLSVEIEAVNQHGDAVLTFTALSIVPSRAVATVQAAA